MFSVIDHVPGYTAAVDADVIAGDEAGLMRTEEKRGASDAGAVHPLLIFQPWQRDSRYAQRFFPLETI